MASPVDSFNAKKGGIMSTTSDQKNPPRTFRRTSDITPASRVVSRTQFPPTSPKMHEVRERYKSLQDEEKKASPGSRKSAEFAHSTAS
jgi:hypothetical protein